MREVEVQEAPRPAPSQEMAEPPADWWQGLSRCVLQCGFASARIVTGRPWTIGRGTRAAAVFPFRDFQRGVVVEQDALGRAVEIVVLPAAQRPHEGAEACGDPGPARSGSR